MKIILTLKAAPDHDIEELQQRATRRVSSAGLAARSANFFFGIPSFIWHTYLHDANFLKVDKLASSMEINRLCGGRNSDGLWAVYTHDNVGDMQGTADELRIPYQTLVDLELDHLIDKELVFSIFSTGLLLFEGELHCK